VRLFYRDEYVVAAHSFDTTRKARWVARSLRDHPIAGVELVSPELLTEAQLRACHDEAYIESVRTGDPAGLAGSQGFVWDPGMWTGARASNGGAVAAALGALGGATAGSLSSGLHHARRASGKGFCTFNGLAIAAQEVLRAGASRVLILDLDAHCGGGTHSFIAGDPRIRQIDVSVSAFDGYVATGGNTLDIVSDAVKYLPTIRERLDGERETFDLVLYNAGMDPFEGCEIGGLDGVTESVLLDRESLVFEWCRRRSFPVAFVLAGGYAGPYLDESTLVNLHRMTIAAAASA
jgi:acetoin utilization deacetylase AcuC-like enzyme